MPFTILITLSTIQELLGHISVHLETGLEFLKVISKLLTREIKTGVRQEPEQV